MIKTAILVSGHTRDYTYYLQDIVSLKNKFNADIFISSYLDKGTGIRFWQGQQEKGEILEPTDIKSILTTLTPKKTIFGPDINTPDYLTHMSFGNRLVSVPGSYKMIYKIWEANNLKLLYEEENKFKYDLVIRTRFDLKYLKVNLEGFNPSLVYGARADIKKYATDTFFASDSSTMDRISLLKDSFGITILPKNYHNCEDLFTNWVSTLGYDLVYGGIEVHLRDKIFN